MRIVHVSDCYAPRVGGIESQVEDLATHQGAAGHAVHVLTATALGRDAVEQGRSRYRTTTTEAAGVRVHRIASPVTFGLPVHPSGRALVRRALEILRPDVVHVHAGVVSPFAFDGARAARDLGLPLAITWHCMLDGVEPAVRLGARAGGWSEAALAPSAVSTVAAERVAHALRRDDVTVLPNGLDLAPWRAAARGTPGPVAPADPGVLRVVATQRLAPRKRAVPLVRLVGAAAETLGRDGRGRPRIRLSIAGSGPAEAALRAEIAAAGLEDVVTLLGRVPREVLPTLYRDQDVFVAPARLEAFGIAPLEARAAGLAVVANAGTGIGEFVADGVDGLLRTGDAGLTGALVDLASDPGLLARIREHNARVAPAVGWPDVLARADELYMRARRD
ncbi:glycosyltransferase family 1 protein [Occultella glacieicola]|uniref:D-inositol 3-phosphate glycosyltransferase n=1 Tax=Occultella glacieicola TaxID=2518684 RepID=A0ABY2E9E1_9MICO|nr:glycosyltransferase family 4 protein [Occultella glacieicola]TDE97598.1 glycosyltransferase family 1 protein [Occultella glacieicola]